MKTITICSLYKPVFVLELQDFYLLSQLYRLVQSGAHNLERATSKRSCHGVFTDQFIFRTVLARVLNIFKFQKSVSKTYRSKNVIFCLFIRFSFPFWYLILRLRSYRHGGDSIFAEKESVKTPWHMEYLVVINNWYSEQFILLMIRERRVFIEGRRVNWNGGRG